MTETLTSSLATKPISKKTRPAFLRKLKVGVVLRWVVALMWVIIALFPLWWVVCVTFSPTGVPVTQQWFPSSLSAGLQKIQMVLQQNQKPTIPNAFMVSLYYIIIQTAGIVIVCSMAAYEFALFKFKGSNFLFTLALSSLMFPLVVTLIPLFRLVVSLKWMNTFQGLAVPGMASAMALFIFRQFMENLPQELMDAARVDGASHFRVYWSIIMPLSWNAILTVIVLNAVGIWGNYLWPLVTMTKPEMQPISVVVAGVAGMQEWKTADFAITVYFLSAIPPIAIYAFLQRYITKGFTMSGLKG
jgi:multiple sugar transport system permease protein